VLHNSTLVNYNYILKHVILPTVFVLKQGDMFEM